MSHTESHLQAAAGFNLNPSSIHWAHSPQTGPCQRPRYTHLGAPEARKTHVIWSFHIQQTLVAEMQLDSRGCTDLLTCFPLLLLVTSSKYSGWRKTFTLDEDKIPLPPLPCPSSSIISPLPDPSLLSLFCIIFSAAFSWSTTSTRPLPSETNWSVLAPSLLLFPFLFVICSFISQIFIIFANWKWVLSDCRIRTLRALLLGAMSANHPVTPKVYSCLLVSLSKCVNSNYVHRYLYKCMMIIRSFEFCVSFGPALPLPVRQFYWKITGKYLGFRQIRSWID